MTNNTDKPFVLDSSVYISYLNERDIFHAQTKTFIQTITSPITHYIVPIIVLLEVGNTLQKISSEFKTEDLMRFFEDHTIVSLELQQAYELLAIFKNFNLKTSDAIILGTAILNKATLITWDEKFQKEAKKSVDTQTPKIFLLMSLAE